jgi:hypothetical protein
MVKEKKKREITVRAPPKPVTPSEKAVEKAAEKALEEERFGVLEISRRLGTYFSASVLAAGVLLLCLSAYVMLAGRVDWMITSLETTFLGFITLIFVGIINVIGGFLLMGSG